MEQIISIGKSKETKDKEQNQIIKTEFLKDEIIEVKRLQEYGLSSNPPEGSLVLGISSGSRDSIFAISVQDKERTKGQAPGDVTLYNGKATVQLKGEKVLINGADVIKAMKDMLDILADFANKPAGYGKALSLESIPNIKAIKGTLNG